VKLIGKGCVGPAVDLGRIALTEEQRQLCGRGFDQKQLEMLKAQATAPFSMLALSSW
jgi:hypothetical protein